MIISPPLPDRHHPSLTPRSDLPPVQSFGAKELSTRPRPPLPPPPADFASGGVPPMLAALCEANLKDEMPGRTIRLATVTALLLALAGVAVQGGFHLPHDAAGWWGLAGLTLLYGTGFTIMFTVLPRLGVVGNSAIMNVEPIFALVLAWAVLDQAIAPSQVAGGLIVVGTVMWLGLRRR